MVNMQGILGKWIALLSLLVWTGSQNSAIAQDCSGKKGENTFEEGSFGSGTANIPATDPKIAPGYEYKSQGEVNDGSYTITNDMTQWKWPFPFENIFGWFLVAADNSGSSNGYFIVVNASYEPGIFYEKRVDGLCEDTWYEFSVDIHNLIRKNFNAIKPNIAFLFDGTEEYETGNVPNNEQWNTYSFAFKTRVGQTSLLLSLRNNAPGGNGNDLALDNITFKPCGPEVDILPEQDVFSCEDDFTSVVLTAEVTGEQYKPIYLQWQKSKDGITWQNIADSTGFQYTHINNEAGIVYYRYLVSNSEGNLQNSKCRIASEAKLITILPKHYEIKDTVCQGSALTFGRRSLTESGTYVDTLTSSLGCDSIVTLELEVLPDPKIRLSLNMKDPSCHNSKNGSIEITDIANGFSPYRIYFNNQRHTTNRSFQNLDSGLYKLEVIDRFLCRVDTQLSLTRPDLFSVSVSKDWKIDLGDPIWIKADANQSVAQHRWLNYSEAGCDNWCDSFSFYPPKSGFLTLKAENEAKCVGRDSVYIEVNPVRKITLYNVFTPNGDGINDFFWVEGEEPNVQEIDEMLIFNRWGNPVFTKNHFRVSQPALGWDGKSDGKPANTGTYFYLVRVRFLDDEVIGYRGTVTLIR